MACWNSLSPQLWRYMQMVQLVANAPGRTITLTFEYNDPDMPQRWEASGDKDTAEFLAFLNDAIRIFPAQSGLKSRYSEIEPGYLLVQALRVCGFKLDDLPIHWEESLQEMYDGISTNQKDGSAY